MSRLEAKHRHVAAARDALIKAAAALTEAPTVENLTFALFQAAVGLMEIAKADEGAQACDRLQRVLRAA